MKSQKSSTISRCSSALTSPDARRRALADVAEQARPADLRTDRLKTPLLHERIGNTRSSRSTVSRIAQAWQYGPK